MNNCKLVACNRSETFGESCKTLQAKEKSPLGVEGSSCGEEDWLGRSGEDCTPGEDESVEGLAANGKPLLRYLTTVY